MKIEIGKEVFVTNIIEYNSDDNPVGMIPVYAQTIDESWVLARCKVETIMRDGFFEIGRVHRGIITEDYRFKPSDPEEYNKEMEIIRPPRAENPEVYPLGFKLAEEERVLVGARKS